MQSPSVSFKNIYIHILIYRYFFSIVFSDHQLRKENNWYVVLEIKTQVTKQEGGKTKGFLGSKKYNFSVEKRKNYPLCKTLY